MRIANFNASNLFKGDAIYCIKFDKQNNLLVGDWSNGVARLKFDFINNSGFSANYLNFDSLIGENRGFTRIVNIHKDDDGNIYLASDGSGFLKIPIDKNTNENDYTIKRHFHYKRGSGVFMGVILYVLDRINIRTFGLGHCMMV